MDDETQAIVAHYSNCPEDGAQQPPGPTLGDIISAFKKVPLPESVLQIQPPGGETLVNFETNFLTEAEPFTTSVTLIGHDVDFRIRATGFHWTYGDGTSATTSKPGARFPRMGVSHVYRTKGRVTASVSTTWSADYRIDRGAWQAVPDTVTITGASQGLRVRTATPVLVGSD